MSLAVGYTHRRYSSASDLDVPSVAGGLTWRALPGVEGDPKGDYVGTGRLERKRPRR